MRCLFVSDLHGRPDRYEKLLAAAEAERPGAVFLGGDLLPLGALSPSGGDFLPDWLAPRLEALRSRLGPEYPRVLAVLGNDDPRAEEESLAELERRSLLEHAHGRRIAIGPQPVYGYACVPPTPFALKDWERYDVSRFVDPGCVSPEEGYRSVAVPAGQTKWGTIAGDLEALVGAADVSRAVFLFHSPPHATALDRAALDGRTVDHVPLDVHVGSIAIRRFIEARQPRLTLHGHVHESARLTGSWQDRIGRTVCLSAAHDGPELALVRFDLDRPDEATRELL
ncbi:MAG TPA: metallophosphoesterase [Vicinamibacteria bacterium]|nr:metallophosphoesterase [Vicinamibacteria bacterium]